MALIPPPSFLFLKLSKIRRNRQSPYGGRRSRWPLLSYVYEILPSKMCLTRYYQAIRMMLTDVVTNAIMHRELATTAPRNPPSNNFFSLIRLLTMIRPNSFRFCSLAASVPSRCACTSLNSFRIRSYGNSATNPFRIRSYKINRGVHPSHRG